MKKPTPRAATDDDHGRVAALVAALVPRIAVGQLQGEALAARIRQEAEALVAAGDVGAVTVLLVTTVHGALMDFSPAWAAGYAERRAKRAQAVQEDGA